MSATTKDATINKVDNEQKKEAINETLAGNQERVIPEGMTGKQLQNMDNGRKQKVSATYTLRACGENAKKLCELGLIEIADLNIISGIQKKAIEKYIREEMGI